MVKTGVKEGNRVKWILILSILLLDLSLGWAMVYMDGLHQKAIHDSSKGSFIVKETYCTSNADCIPNNCCHASACVNTKNAPNCIGVVCTQVCAPGTIDCNQGSCSCIKNKCTAIFR